MKLKQVFSLFFAVLLLCGVCAPSVLAQSQTLLSSGSANTNSSSNAGAVVLTRFDEPDRTDAVAFAVGTSQNELSEWFAYYYGGFTGYDAQGTTYDLMTGTWSLQNVDTATPGVYYAYATPNLGDTYLLGDGVSLPKQLCAVSIQTPGKPDINCCVSARSFLHFPWVLSTEQQNQLKQFTVLLRQDNGTWENLSEGFYLTSDDFQLSQRIFEKASTYDLQVLYPGGKTGILTFQYDNEFLIVDYAKGDRDGGDVDGGGQSSGTQPAPSSSPTPSHFNDSNVNSSNSASVPNNSSAVLSETPAKQDSASEKSAFSVPTPSSSQSTATESGTESDGISREQDSIQVIQNHVQKIENIPSQASTASQGTSSTVQEFYSPSQTVISGLRLRDLCAGEKSVVFGAGDLTVSIPSEHLLALKLADSDTFSVQLTQSESNRIMLAVNTAGNPVTALSGTVLRLRYTPQSEDAVITVRDKEGNPVTNTAFDGEFLHFTVNKAGTYTILEVSAVPKESKAAQSSDLPLLPLMGGGLILAAGGTALVRRKFHG